MQITYILRRESRVRSRYETFAKYRNYYNTEIIVAEAARVKYRAANGRDFG